MRVHNYVLSTPDEVRELGSQIAGSLAPGQLVTLSGPLGAGKTTLVQGVARGLGIEDSVTSPTFVLMLEYPGLVHMDAYRLEGLDPEALTDAGVFDVLTRQDVVKIIEWPEILSRWLPKADFDLKLNILEDGRREVRVELP